MMERLRPNFEKLELLLIDSQKDLENLPELKMKPQNEEPSGRIWDHLET